MFEDRKGEMAYIPKKPKLDWSELHRQWEAGEKTQKIIAKEHGISPRTVIRNFQALTRPKK